MADYSIDPEQVCQDIDAVAERAQSATSNDANAAGGRASDPRWAEVKAILLEMVEDLEREADEAEAVATETN